ncbi:hypothetical protein SPHV1_30017 [Novosphingobium sp. KN65.2]|nr:hypothetical protein SPHV1_30017 [Novosphingobium sp. KN65.2]
MTPLPLRQKARKPLLPRKAKQQQPNNPKFDESGIAGRKRSAGVTESPSGRFRLWTPENQLTNTAAPNRARLAVIAVRLPLILTTVAPRT